MDFSSKGNAITDAYFLSESKDTGGRGLSPDFSVTGPRASNLKKDFKLVTGCKYHKSYFGH